MGSESGLIVLDTHVWLWWWSDQRDALSSAAVRAVETAEVVGIPAISCWEIALLERRGRISLDRDAAVWIAQSLSTDRVKLLELTPQVAVSAARLVWDHSDPADRLIVATAIVHRAPVVTKDDRIRRYQPAHAIW